MTDVKWFHRRLAAVVLLALLVALAFQGSRGIYETTEGRYSLCAWEMVRNHNWLEPTLAGKPHWTKPPLAYWTIAAGMELLGRNAWGARVPNAIAFAATVAVVGILGARLWDCRTGLLAALVYATAFFPVLVAHTVNTDTVLTLWEVGAVLGFWCATTAVEPRRRQRWIFGMWCLFGLGFLTKGPPALLPLLAIVTYQHLTPKEKRAVRLWQPLGLLAFFLLGFGWYLAIVIRHPNLVSYFVGDEIVNRVASDKFHRNPEWYQPFRLYAPLLLLGGGLWGYYAIRFLGEWRWWTRAAWQQVRRQAGPNLFLLLWLFLPLTVFALSKSRLPNYVVPLFPVTALVTARYAVRGWVHERMPGRFVWLAGVSAAVLILVKGFVGFIPELGEWLSRTKSPLPRRWGGELLNHTKPDMGYLYRLCQPWDDPATTRFVLFEQERLFGFDVYAASDVSRAFEDAAGKVRARDLTQVLQEIMDRRVPQTRHVFICRDYTVPAIRKRLDQVGLGVEDVAQDVFWHLLLVRTPGP